jgi:hypothetical protein
MSEPRIPMNARQEIVLAEDPMRAKAVTGSALALGTCGQHGAGSELRKLPARKVSSGHRTPAA